MNSISVREVIGKAITKISDTEDQIWGDLNSATAGLTKLLLETMAESEVERRIGAQLYERGETRQDYRNGYRERTVQMSHQVIEIQIPRLRGQGFIPSFIEPKRRAIEQVEDWVEKAYLSGLNRSEVIRLLEATTGCRPSSDLLKRVSETIDKQVKEFRERKLCGRYQYLFLDAAWAKDIVGINATRICIMTAVGITDTGEKEILGFERTARENEAGWRGFIRRLVERGLDPRTLELVISDEHGGLINAASEILGDVPHQWCWAHRVRNVCKALLKSDRKEAAEGLRAVFKADNLAQAKEAFRKWRNRWHNEYPSVVASVEEDLGHLLAFYSCSSLHWEYVRTSNPIERVFRELRRQQYGSGAFANRDACNRAVYKIYRLLNEMWCGKNIWEPRKLKMQKQESNS